MNENGSAFEQFLQMGSVGGAGFLMHRKEPERRNSGAISSGERHRQGFDCRRQSKSLATGPFKPKI
jgi:hypothetical protein